MTQLPTGWAWAHWLRHSATRGVRIHRTATAASEATESAALRATDVGRERRPSETSAGWLLPSTSCRSAETTCEPRRWSCYSGDELVAASGRSTRLANCSGPSGAYQGRSSAHRPRQAVLVAGYLSRALEQPRRPQAVRAARRRRSDPQPQPRRHSDSSPFRRPSAGAGADRGRHRGGVLPARRRRGRPPRHPHPTQAHARLRPRRRRHRPTRPPRPHRHPGGTLLGAAIGVSRRCRIGLPTDCGCRWSWAS